MLTGKKLFFNYKYRSRKGSIKPKPIPLKKNPLILLIIFINMLITHWGLKGRKLLKKTHTHNAK